MVTAVRPTSRKRNASDLEYIEQLKSREEELIDEIKQLRVENSKSKDLSLLLHS